MHASEPAPLARGPDTAGGTAESAPAATVALGYQSVRAPVRITAPQVRRQADAIGDHCSRKGWALLTVLRDIDDGHGRGPAQPALSNAIERLHSGEASCLVVAELRQLCPSIADLGGIFEVLEGAGARFVSLEPPFDTGTPIGGAVARMLKTVSDWERGRRADMTAAARSKVAIAQTIPLKLRRRIVRMRKAGMTLQAIADRLNEEGVPTLRGGARWRPSSVQATLGYKRPRPWTPTGGRGSIPPKP